MFFGDYVLECWCGPAPDAYTLPPEKAGPLSRYILSFSKLSALLTNIYLSVYFCFCGEFRIITLRRKYKKTLKNIVIETHDLLFFWTCLIIVCLNECGNILLLDMFYYRLLKWIWKYVVTAWHVLLSSAYMNVDIFFVII